MYFSFSLSFDSVSFQIYWHARTCACACISILTHTYYFILYMYSTCLVRLVMVGLTFRRILDMCVWMYVCVRVRVHTLCAFWSNAMQLYIYIFDQNHFTCYARKHSQIEYKVNISILWRFFFVAYLICVNLNFLNELITTATKTTRKKNAC